MAVSIVLTFEPQDYYIPEILDDSFK